LLLATDETPREEWLQMMIWTGGLAGVAMLMIGGRWLAAKLFDPNVGFPQRFGAAANKGEHLSNEG
jgi:hypothetical protein